MISRAYTYAVRGLGAELVTIEVDIRQGLPAFSIVGAPDTAVRESRERVRAAILNSGFEFPQRRITVGFSPSSENPKLFPSTDLAIAYAILAASGQVAYNDDEFVLAGELSLDGSVRPIHGTLSICEAADSANYVKVVVPKANLGEARLAGVAFTAGISRLEEVKHEAFPEGLASDTSAPAKDEEYAINGPDLKDLRGHESSIRALEIAAAGGHSVYFSGAPGCGKTMLARRLPSILPPLTHEEALDVTRIQSITGLLRGDGLVTQRPFRAPHHSVSAAGLLGSGRLPIPGEISLASNGVLFLDELSEFSSRAIASLAHAVENESIEITCGAETRVFPAHCQLVAAANPCPCGSGDRRCRCSVEEIARFNRRITSTLLNNFDVFARVTRPTPADVEAGPYTTSEEVRARVIAARELQTVRYAELPGVTCNADLDAAQSRKYIVLTPAAEETLARALRNGAISVRDCDRQVRIARTIADLEGQTDVDQTHLDRASGYLPDVVLEPEEALVS